MLWVTQLQEIAFHSILFPMTCFGLSSRHHQGVNFQLHKRNIYEKELNILVLFYYYSITGNNILLMDMVHIRCEGKASTQRFLLYNCKLTTR